MNEERVYSRADVEALAHAVIENWYDFSDSSLVCNFCFATYNDKLPNGDPRHDVDCPTRIAQDVLTP